MWAQSEFGECIPSSSKIIKSGLIDRAIKSKDHQIESQDTQQKPSQEAEGVRSLSRTLCLSCQSFPTVDILYHGIAIVTPVERVAFMGVFRNIAPFHPPTRGFGGLLKTNMLGSKMGVKCVTLIPRVYF